MKKDKILKHRKTIKCAEIVSAGAFGSVGFLTPAIALADEKARIQPRATDDGFPADIGPCTKGKDLPIVAWVDATGMPDSGNLANPSHYDLQMHEFSYGKYDGYCLNPFRWTPLSSNAQRGGTLDGIYNKIMWYAQDHNFELGGADATENSIILRYLFWTNSNENGSGSWALPLDKVNFYDTPQAQRVKKAVYKITEELKDYPSPSSTEDPKPTLSKVGTPKVNSDGSITYTFEATVGSGYTTKTKTKVDISGASGTIKQDGKTIKDGGEIELNKNFTVTVPASGTAKQLKVSVGFDIKQLKAHEYDAIAMDAQNFILYDKEGPIETKKAVTVDVPATTSKIIVHKVDDENKPLANVEFQLYKSDKKTKVGSVKKTNSKGEIVWDNLPIGTYYVKEVKAPNDGYNGDFTFKQAQLTVDNKDKGVTIKVTNEHKQPEMLSILENGDQENQKVVDASNVTLKDEVQAKFLRKGEKYRVKESFYDIKDKDMKSPIKTTDGKTEVYSNELTAKDDVSQNTFTATGKIDLTNTKIEKIVAVPTVQRYKDGKWTDVKKESKAFESGSQQQVSVVKPNITTMLHSDNNKVVNPYSEVPFTDITSSTQAVPNKEYMYKGKLMVVDEKGNATPLKTKDGKEVTKEVKIKADKDGNIKTNVDFGNIDTTQLKGKNIVAFEYLYTSDGKTLLAKEENPENKDQTITVTNPKMHTTALINGQHGSATPNKETMISDLVEVTDFTTNTPISLSAIASDEKGNLLEYTSSKDGKKYNLMGKVNVDFNKPNDKLSLAVTAGKDGLSNAKVEVPLSPVESKGNQNVSELEGSKRVSINNTDTTEGGSAVNTNDLKGKKFTLYEDMLTGGKDVVISHPTSDDKEGIEQQSGEITKPEMHTTALIDLNTNKTINANEYSDDAQKGEKEKTTTEFKSDDEIQKEFGGKKQTNPTRKVKPADVVQYNGYHKGDVIDATVMARDSKTGKPYIVKNSKGEDCVLVGRTTVIAQGESGTFTVPLKAVKVSDAEKLFGGKTDKEIALNIVKNTPLTFGTIKDNGEKQEASSVENENSENQNTSNSEDTSKVEDVKDTSSKGGETDNSSNGDSSSNNSTTESTSNEEGNKTVENETTDSNSTEEIDASQLAGDTLTFFEVLTTPEERENPENVTVSETDKDNKSQQIKVNKPEIQTIQRVNGNKSILDSETGKYIDTVKYSNLTPNEQVTLKVVETKNGQPVKTKDGKYLVGTKTFTPKEANGTVDVEMKPTSEKPADELLNKVIDEKTGKIAPSFDYVTPKENNVGEATNGENTSLADNDTSEDTTKDIDSLIKEAQSIVDKYKDAKDGTTDHVIKNNAEMVVDALESLKAGSDVAIDKNIEIVESAMNPASEANKPNEEQTKDLEKLVEILENANGSNNSDTESSSSSNEETASDTENSSSNEETTKGTNSSESEKDFDSETTKAEGAKLEEGQYTAFETMYGDTDENGTPTVIAEHKDKNDKGQTVTVNPTPETPKSSKQVVKSTPAPQAQPAPQATTSQPTTLAQTGSGSKVTRNKLYNIVYGFFH